MEGVNYILNVTSVTIDSYSTGLNSPANAIIPESDLIIKIIKIILDFENGSVYWKSPRFIFTSDKNFFLGKGLIKSIKETKMSWLCSKPREWLSRSDVTIFKILYKDYQSATLSGDIYELIADITNDRSL